MSSHQLCFVILVVALVPAAYSQPNRAAGNQQQPSLRHGTLLLTSITLLDRPTTTSLAEERAAKGHGVTSITSSHQRCCLTVKAYTAPFQPSSSAAQNAAQQASTAASAVFSTCSNTTAPETGCREALLHGSTSPHPAAYKVALLLPAQQVPSAAADPDSMLQKPAGPRGPLNSSSAHNCSSNCSHVSTGSSSTHNTTLPGSTGAQHVESRSPAAAGAARPARQSTLHDVLVTVHAEQEVLGQVYLTIITQVVHAGTGVSNVNIDMSHYTHTWARDPPPPPARPAVTASDTTTCQAAGVSSTASEATDVLAASPAKTAASELVAVPGSVPADAAGHEAVDTSTSTSTFEQLQPSHLDNGQQHKAASASTGTLLELLPATLTADPTALASYLHHVLGYDVPGAATGHQQQQQQFTADCLHSAHSPRRCTCPAAQGGASAAEAAQAWAAELQAALHSCQHDSSLRGHWHLHASSTAVLTAAQSQTQQLRGWQQQQPPVWLDRWIVAVKMHQGPFSMVVAPLGKVLEFVGASVLPALSSISHEQLALAIAATAALLLLLVFIVACTSTASRSRRHSLQAAVTTRQHQLPHEEHHRAPAEAPAQDACPPQQQDQGPSLDDVLQDLDTDPFGYGAAPAAAARTSAALLEAPGPGSFLAAAKVVKRASVMAAGEAAGALKDAFMRRTSHSAATAAGTGTLHSSARAKGPQSAAAPAAAAAAVQDWLDEENEDKVNQLPDSVQRQLQAGGRWARDAEGRLVRSSWKAVRNSLAAAAQAVVAAVGGSGAAAGAADEAAAVAGAGEAAGGGFEDTQDAAALQQLLSAAPGDVITFAGQ